MRPILRSGWIRPRASAALSPRVGLLLPDVEAAHWRACAQATAWALARLELGALHGDEIPERAASEGGVKRIATAWQREKAQEPR